MQRIPRLMCLMLLGLATAVVPARAQELTRERVQMALDETDRHIERAQAVVAGSDNEQAELELQAAIRLQGEARTAFLQVRLRLAVDLTFRARARADRAYALIKGLPDPDRVLAQLERTRELLDRARDRIEECDNDRARAMLRAAFEMQTRAEDAARAGRYLAALQLTMSARERALKALRLCNMEENASEAAERALRRTDEVIARAQEVVVESGVERAREMLSRATEIQARAWAEFRAERFEASLRLTLSARAFAHRAVRLANRTS